MNILTRRSIVMMIFWRRASRSSSMTAERILHFNILSASYFALNVWGLVFIYIMRIKDILGRQNDNITRHIRLEQQHHKIIKKKRINK